MKNSLFATIELKNTKTYAPDMFSFICANSVITNNGYDCAPAELKGHEWGKIGRSRCRT